MPRLFVRDRLDEGIPVRLAPEQARYLTRVMRQAPGDGIRLFNGRDGEWRGEILETGSGGCTVGVREHLRAQAGSPDLHLVFAPAKGGRVESAVRQATELGVSHIRPVTVERSVVRQVNRARLERIAVEAAEQCERLDLPRMDAIRPFPDLLADWPADRVLTVFDPEGEPPRPGTDLGRGVATGPEGGFAPRELDALHELGFVRIIRIGPRLLRTDTAVVAALSVWQTLSGGWS